MQLLSNPKKGKENTEKNLLLVIFLLILLGIGGSYQFLLPDYKKTKQDNVFLKAQKDSAEKDLASLTNVEEMLTKGKSELENRGIDLEKVKRVYPENENMPEVYIQIDQISEEFKDLKPNIQISNPTSAQIEKSAKIPLTMSAQGDQFELEGFIDRLKNNIRPIILTSVNYSVINNIKGEFEGFSMQATGNMPIKAISEVYSGN